MRYHLEKRALPGVEMKIEMWTAIPRDWHLPLPAYPSWAFPASPRQHQWHSKSLIGQIVRPENLMRIGCEIPEINQRRADQG